VGENFLYCQQLQFVFVTAGNPVLNAQAVGRQLTKRNKKGRSFRPALAK
jgi:hypothetical protein